MGERPHWLRAGHRLVQRARLILILLQRAFPFRDSEQYQDRVIHANEEPYPLAK
jgi:hypothetical protein